MQAAVYTELKEGSVSSPPENYPLAMMKDFINEGYFDVFNQPNAQPYLRETVYTFQGAADTTLSSDVTAGDVTLSVASTTNFASTGQVLVDGVDIVTYTGKTATSLTGCTGTSVDHDSGKSVRYLHAFPSDIEGLKVQYLKDANARIEYVYVPWETFLASPTYAFSFSIINGRLLLPAGATSRAYVLSYLSEPVEMSADDDTPSLIPDQFHKMLVFYATGRALLQEEDTRGYTYFNPDARGINGKPGAGLYFTWLHKFYAKFGRRTNMKRITIPFRYTAR